MRKLFVLLAFVLFINGCGKDDSPVIDPDPIAEEPQEVVNVIKSENSTILSTQEELDQGKYIIEFSETVPDIKVGDVIVGDNEEGYLRKVTSVSSNGKILTMSTSQGTMEDIFENKVFSVNADLSSKGNKNPVTEKTIINYMAKGVSMSADGFTFDFSDTEIYKQGPVTAKISSGQATFNPNFVFDFEFEDSELESFVFKAENSSLGLNMEFLLNATSSVNLGSHEKELVDYQKIFTTFVGFVPVIITVNTKLIAKMTMDVDATFNLTTGFSNSNTVTLGASYISGSWEGINNLSSNFTPSPLEMGGVVNLEQKISVVPEVSVRFYGVAGPYAIPEMYLANHVGVASPSLDWDASLSAGVDLEVGADAKILGKSLVGFSKKYSASQVLINAPDKIEIVSGNNQTGIIGNQLAEPIKVKVTDSFGKTWENVPVHFGVTQGGGSVETASVQTDSEGFAEVMWTLGTDGSEQKLKATIKKSDGSTIGDVEFNVTSQNIQLSLSGDLDFGDVILGSTKEAELTIANAGDVAINVSEIELPDGFTADWSSGEIEAATSKIVTLTFTPIAVQEYSGDVTVTNDGDQENNTIAISGSGIESPLTLSGDLDFGDVVKDTTSDATLTISNSGESAINVSGIDLPAGFTADWNDGEIAGNSTQDVIITFSPTSVQNYSGTIIVKNDTDQENNAIAILGSGVEDSNNYDNYVELILGTWVESGVNENGINIFVEGCDITLEFGTSQITSTEYYGDECLEKDIVVSSYSINGNILTETGDGNTSSSEILELTSDKLVFKVVDGSYILVYTFTREATTMSLSGNLNFGDVLIGTSANANFTIVNNGSSSINVSSLSLPTGYSANWIGGPIEGGVSKEVNITFAPTDEQDYAGTITVNNDTDEINNSIAVSGNGVKETNTIIDMILGTWSMSKLNGEDFYYGEEIYYPQVNCTSLYDKAEIVNTLTITFTLSNISYIFKGDRKTFTYNNLDQNTCDYSSMTIVEEKDIEWRINSTYSLVDEDTIKISTEEGDSEDWTFTLLDSNTLKIVHQYLDRTYTTTLIR